MYTGTRTESCRISTTLRCGARGYDGSWTHQNPNPMPVDELQRISLNTNYRQRSYRWEMSDGLLDEIAPVVATAEEIGRAALPGSGYTIRRAYSEEVEGLHAMWELSKEDVPLAIFALAPTGNETNLMWRYLHNVLVRQANEPVRTSAEPPPVAPWLAVLMRPEILSHGPSAETPIDWLGEVDLAIAWSWLDLWHPSTLH